MGSHRVIDIHLLGCVLRQFRKVQGILDVTTYFARTTREVGDWGACVQPHVEIVEFDALSLVLWGWNLGVVDLGFIV